MTVGVRNLGPATLDLSRLGESAVVVLVTAPAGTTATTIPNGCEKSDGMFPSKPGAAYLCYSHPLLPAGTGLSWTFELKVSKASANALGSVVRGVRRRPRQGEQHREDRAVPDRQTGRHRRRPADHRTAVVGGAGARLSGPEWVFVALRG